MEISRLSNKVSESLSVRVSHALHQPYLQNAAKTTAQKTAKSSGVKPQGLYWQSKKGFSRSLKIAFSEADELLRTKFADEISLAAKTPRKADSTHSVVSELRGLKNQDRRQDVSNEIMGGFFEQIFSAIKEHPNASEDEIMDKIYGSLPPDKGLLNLNLLV